LCNQIIYFEDALLGCSEGVWGQDQEGGVKEFTGSSIATATKRNYVAPIVFIPGYSGFKYYYRIT